MKLLHSPTQLCQSACKCAPLSNHLSLCGYSLYVTKRIVPFLLFTFSHSEPPLPLHSPLFVPAKLDDCLFIFGPAEASAFVDEIVMVIIAMVIVMFLTEDKGSESHRMTIGFATDCKHTLSRTHTHIYIYYIYIYIYLFLNLPL